jgi:hypothetical protein
MKKLFAVVALFAVLNASAADRVTIESETSIQVYKTELNTLPDGGCSVLAYATFTKADGGVTNEPSNKGTPFEVGGVNRTDCLNINNVRAPALFKATSWNN